LRARRRSPPSSGDAAPSRERDVDVGVVLPLGIGHEFVGVDPTVAWERCSEMARLADRSRFESLWLYDHFHTDPVSSEAVSFEAMAALAALVPITTDITLGHLVLSAGFRNPAVVVKALSSLDAMSGGRIALGLGSGWKQDEWLAYGFGFPDLQVRQAMLHDALEVATRMMRPGIATYEGPHASVHGAVNEPKPTRKPRIPIVVGGNGRTVTWRLAAEYADELNLNVLSPARVATSLPFIADRCREAGRDPASLHISVHLTGELAGRPGAERVDRLAEYEDLGVHRVMLQVPGWAESDDALLSLADDVRTLMPDRLAR
jgi:alkanesulfonate monooxygenase SsuD/methylene tetrahydromethanopterin reductase-like flavin-dependent oxidoreductase (luciferase family)